ncbi:MAG: hypothetical protein JWN38_422 [Candidatus Saccharibacteria bacterium]|nr:hypothetical protein [Candidatus Saccharibacteria bacterium]
MRLTKEDLASIQAIFEAQNAKFGAEFGQALDAKLGPAIDTKLESAITAVLDERFGSDNCKLRAMMYEVATEVVSKAINEFDDKISRTIAEGFAAMDVRFDEQERHITSHDDDCEEVRLFSGDLEARVMRLEASSFRHSGVYLD